MTEKGLHDKLEAGWDWMLRAPDGDEKNAFFDRWLDAKDEYERTFGFEKKPEITLPSPSPWIEEVREQLILGGTADVERKRIDRRTGA
jgi:hypothetical protein